MANETTIWKTAKQAAEHLQVSVATIRRAVKRGRLPVFVVNDGRNVRFRQADLDQLFKVRP